jgi:hypothetical protein
MIKNPEKLGVAIHDELGRFLEAELPKLKKSLRLESRSSEAQIQAERELAVFIAFCLVQACAHEVEDDARRQNILTAFFKAAAGDENLGEFVSALQPRFEEYEQAVFHLKPEQVAFEAAGMLNDRLFPGEPSDGARLEILSKLYPTMDAACRRVMDGH